MAFRIPHFGSERTILDDLAGVLRRRKLVVGLTLLATVLGAYAALLYVTEKYEAEARLLVTLGRENAEAPLTVERGGVYTTGVQKEEINSYIQLLTSRDLIEQTVDTMGVDRFRFEPEPPRTFFQRVKAVLKGLARAAKKQLNALLVRLDLREELSERDKAVELVKRSLKVSREGESNVIRIALRLPSAELARDTVQTLIDLYLDRHVKLRRADAVLPVFDQAVHDYREEIEQLQRKREQTQQRYHLSDVAVQRARLLDRLHDLERQIDANGARRASLEQRQAALQRKLAVLDAQAKAQEVVEPNPALPLIKERLVELRVKRAELASKYEPTAPPVARVDEEIASIEALLKQEPATQQGPVTFERNPLRQSFEEELARNDVELASLAAETRSKEQSIETIRQQLQRLNEGETALQLIDLDLQVLQQKFLANSTRREEARINEELDKRRVANVSVLSPPTAAPFPVQPKKMLVMGLSVAAGLLLGVGLGVLLEWGDDTIYSKAELVRATDVPYLGQFRLGGASALQQR
ncbi:MAG: hypothetical protein D6824_00170 [Planctomycetota bacterium]|nr:MAG: hypothetical protein D6824_00170 [Planctomycetota bacterium]